MTNSERSPETALLAQQVLRLAADKDPLFARRAIELAAAVLDEVEAATKKE